MCALAYNKYCSLDKILICRIEFVLYHLIFQFQKKNIHSHDFVQSIVELQVSSTCFYKITWIHGKNILL